MSTPAPSKVGVAGSIRLRGPFGEAGERVAAFGRGADHPHVIALDGEGEGIAGCEAQRFAGFLGQYDLRLGAEARPADGGRHADLLRPVTAN